jgi:hypothetical protein
MLYSCPPLDVRNQFFNRSSVACRTLALSERKTGSFLLIEVASRNRSVLRRTNDPIPRRIPGRRSLRIKSLKSSIVRDEIRVT